MILISLPGWEKDLKDDKQELVSKRKMEWRGRCFTRGNSIVRKLYPVSKPWRNHTRGSG